MKPFQILLDNAQGSFLIMRKAVNICDTRHPVFTQQTDRETPLRLISLWSESCLSMCCFPLAPVNRQLAALLWQGRELPDTLVTAWLVSGRFSTLTLGVWWAANVLEGWLTEEEMIMSLSSLAWIELFLSFLCRLSNWATTAKHLFYSHSWVKQHKWLTDYLSLKGPAYYGWN